MKILQTTGLIFLSLLISSPVLAQQTIPNWVAIAKKNDGTEVFADTNYFVKKGNMVSVRLYERLNQPQADGTLQTITIHAISCTRKLGTILTLSKFNAQGEMIDYIQNANPRQLANITPNSVADVAFRYGCYK